MHAQRQCKLFQHLSNCMAATALVAGTVAGTALAQPQAEPAAAAEPQTAAAAAAKADANTQGDNDNNNGNIDNMDTHPSREQRDMQLLAAKLPADSVHWLEAEGESFLAIYEADYTGSPQGAVLILHAEGRHPAWHSALEAIRRELPQHGWATLAAALPSPAVPAVPARPAPPPPAPAQAAESAPAPESDQASPPDPADTGETAQPGESEEVFNDATGAIGDGSAAPAAAAEPAAAPPKPVEQRVNARLNSALQFLQQRGMLNLVILGHGVGAARAAEFYRAFHASAAGGRQGGAISPLRALIFINARNRIPMTEVDLPLSLTDPALPVLDLYYRTDLRDQREAERRRQQARRQRLENFVQLRMPRQISELDADKNPLLRRVRGFLDRYAAGMEIDEAGAGR